GVSRVIVAILVVIIVVLAGALAYVSLRQPTTPSPPAGTFSVQSAQPTSVQGQSLRFVISNLKAGAKARVYFGDGQVLETSNTTLNYTYNTPGEYLVWVQQFFPSNGTVLNDYSGALFRVTVVPDVPFELSQFVSVPTIYFNTTVYNPTAPIVAVNSPIYLYGNFTEVSQLRATSTTHHDSTTNITDTETVTVAVDHYDWDFGNGQTMTVAADPSGSFPVTNPIPVRYAASGLYTPLLTFYNANSTTVWFPYLASEVPSVSNGEITGSNTTYTFHLRPDVAFSNGDPITAYDVWYSTIRSMLFQGGEPGTADWIISQYLIPRNPPGIFTPFEPIVNKTNKAAAFTAISRSVTYDNGTNTVTFHLVGPTPPSLFFTAISDPLGMGILDAAWLKSVGADITFTPDGFLAYEDQSKE